MQRMNISDYYNSLPDRKARRDFRESLITELKMSQTSIYEKIRNNSWTVAETIAINEVIIKQSYEREN